MIQVVCLASSSAGNMFIVKNNDTKILLECGVEKKELLKYLIENNLNIMDFNCCLISHIHNDHSLQMDFVSQYIPIYSTIELHTKFPTKVKSLEIKKAFGVGTMKIVPIPIEHGDCENYAYIIGDKDSLIFFATDFYLMEQNISNFKFNEVYIECNYDEDILNKDLNDKESYNRKKLIRQISTHMSINNCILHLKNMDLSECKKITLLHPSNFYINKDVAIKKIKEEFNNIQVEYAKRK